MDLERALLEGDLTRFAQDVGDAERLAEEIHESMGGQTECGLLWMKLTRLKRDVKTFEERWKEYKPANARPKSRKRTPEAKEKDRG